MMFIIELDSWNCDDLGDEGKDYEHLAYVKVRGFIPIEQRAEFEEMMNKHDNFVLTAVPREIIPWS